MRTLTFRRFARWQTLAAVATLATSAAASRRLVTLDTLAIGAKGARR